MKSLFRIKMIIFLLSMGLLKASTEGSTHSDANCLTSWIKPDPGIFLWTIVTFLIVLLILKVKAWGPLVEALENREKQVEDSLKAAEKAIEEAEKVSSDYEQSIKDAQIESQKIISNSKKSAEKVKAEIEKAALEKAELMVENAKEQINSEKENAIKDIRDIAIDLSIDIASKVIEKNIDSEENRRLIEEAMDNIGES